MSLRNSHRTTQLLDGLRDCGLIGHEFGVPSRARVLEYCALEIEQFGATLVEMGVVNLTERNRLHDLAEQLRRRAAIWDSSGMNSYKVPR